MSENRRRRRHGGEQPMVPDAEFRSYYGKPIINQPVWEARDIAGYFFLGGLAGSSSVLAAGAQLTGRERLATTSKLVAASAISLSFVALVHDLGRPARFLNMLRTFKPTSPMSVGTWLLSAYGPAAAIAGLTALTGSLPLLGTAATAGAAALGPLVASYTGALLADTAVPSWHEAHRELPLVFAASATTAAAGAALIGAPVAETGPARRLAIGAGLGEVVLREWMTKKMGLVGETYHLGKARRYGRISVAATLAGVAGSAAFGRRNRPLAALAGAALLAGSAFQRFSTFESGMISANDPKYTVVPQRRRLESGGQ